MVHIFASHTSNNNKSKSNNNNRAERKLEEMMVRYWAFHGQNAGLDVMDIHLSIHSTVVRIKYVPLFICQSYFSRVAKNNTRETFAIYYTDKYHKARISSSWKHTMRSNWIEQETAHPTTTRVLVPAMTQRLTREGPLKPKTRVGNYCHLSLIKIFKSR